MRGNMHCSLLLYLIFQYQTMVLFQNVRYCSEEASGFLKIVQVNVVCLFVCLSSLPLSIENVRSVIGNCPYADTFNPLTPNTDQHLISPYNIIPESNIKVMRVKEMITN